MYPLTLQIEVVIVNFGGRTISNGGQEGDGSRVERSFPRESPINGGTNLPNQPSTSASS